MSNTLVMNWNKSDGLIPAIIQDAKSNAVLMLGYMNQESLEITKTSGKVTFFSRTRQAIWLKGETSGNFFNVVEIKPDCDQDALLITVNPDGPACHRETETCFDSDVQFLAELDGIIEDRFKNPAATSYTNQLIQEGLDRVTQKVGEEAIETVIAAKNSDLKNLEGEAADLIFHLMVLLRFKKTSLAGVMNVLRSRHQRAEKRG